MKTFLYHIRRDLGELFSYSTSKAEPGYPFCKDQSKEQMNRVFEILDSEYQTKEDKCKTEKVYDKLVRDNIPDICRANGEEPFTRVLNDEEYWEYLLKKDMEELKEVETAKSLEERKKELGDKLELIRAMAEFSGFSLDDIIDEADRKKQKNGGFEKRLLLEKVIKVNKEG